MKLTFEDNSALIDVETTLKMLLQHAELKPHHKSWVIESYKNIVNFRINQVVKEQAKMQEWHLSRLKDELKEIKDESK